MKINWEEIESIGKTKRGNDKKIYLDHLPKGGKFISQNRINWKESVGREIYVFYDNEEYILKIEDYDKKKGNVIVNVVGYNNIDFKINTANLPKCKLGSLINNVYADPNSPNRELIINSIGEEKAKTLQPYSNTKIEIVCPDCKSRQSIGVDKLTERGFRCKTCSDGLSYSERLTRNLLIYLNVEFITQKTFDEGKHYYDFYLPKYNAIIETHGIQHYEQTRRNGKRVRTLEEEQENDKLKREIALQHGIKDVNYHEVDCRVSTLEYCKNGLIKAIENYLNIELTDEQWEYIEIKSQSNILKQVVDDYNNGIEEVRILSDKYNLDRSTIQNYLNRGTKLGLCHYNGKIAQKKLVSIPIVATHVETEEVIEFESYAQANKMFGYKSDYIKKCIEGKRDSYKNYKWKLKTN